MEAGSMLPKDEIAQRQEAVELLQYITPIITPVIGQNPGIIMPIIRMVIDTFELPHKQEVLDDLQEALGMAKEVAQQTNLANNAATEAGAMSQIQALLGGGAGGADQVSQEVSENVQEPTTEQGRRADIEADAALEGRMPVE
jgi:hypothetical protein